MYTKILESAGSLLRPPTSERLKSGYVVLKPGETVGEHTTADREEMLIILAGHACIECEGERVELAANAVAFIPRDSRHNVINQSAEDLRYIYLVTPVA